MVAVTIFRPPILVAGSYLRIDMFGRCGMQTSDELFYIGVGKVECLGWASDALNPDDSNDVYRSIQTALQSVHSRLLFAADETSATTIQVPSSEQPPVFMSNAEIMQRRRADTEILARQLQEVAKVMAKAKSTEGLKERREMWIYAAEKVPRVSPTVRATHLLPIFLLARRRELNRLRSIIEQGDADDRNQEASTLPSERRNITNEAENLSINCSKQRVLSPENDPAEYYFRMMDDSGRDIDEREGVAMVHLIESSSSLAAVHSNGIETAPMATRFDRLLSENRINCGLDLGQALWDAGDRKTAAAVWSKGNVADKIIFSHLRLHLYAPLVDYILGALPSPTAELGNIIRDLAAEQGHEEACRFGAAAINVYWNLRTTVCEALKLEVTELERIVQSGSGSGSGGGYSTGHLLNELNKHAVYLALINKSTGTDGGVHVSTMDIGIVVFKVVDAEVVRMSRKPNSKFH
ncbi:hypothetical protein HDU93_005616 [Gonapodya sp. JEL0774]|nr:hypothetical protein HDU93_005616 [Gonapodya sp. JEL0774]